jgi:hypothetical protein
MVICKTDIPYRPTMSWWRRTIFAVVTSSYPTETLGSVASSLAAALFQGNADKNTSPEIFYQLRDSYCICMCRWNVATYKLKVHNGKF